MVVASVGGQVVGLMVPLHRIALNGGISSFKLQASGSFSLRIERET